MCLHFVFGINKHLQRHSLGHRSSLENITSSKNATGEAELLKVVSDQGRVLRANWHSYRKMLHQSASPSPNPCGSSRIIISSQSFYLLNNINFQRGLMDLLLFAGASFSNALCILEVHWSGQLQVCRQKLSRTVLVVFVA